MTKTMTPHSGSGVLIRLPVIGKLLCYGKTVPADGADGFATGCLFLHYDGSAAGVLYVNDGSVTSADFNAVVGYGNALAAQTITALTATTAGITTGNITTATIDTLFRLQGAPAAIADGNTTMTIANILTGICTMAATEARSPVLPTGTLTAAQIAVGDAFDWSFINLAAGDSTVTVQPGVGHTIVGSAAIAQNVTARFRTRISVANTAITYRIG